MSITIGDAVLYIVGNDTELNKTLNGVQAGIDKRLNSIQSGLNKWGSRLTVGLTAPIVAMGTMAVKAASNLREAKDLTKDIFEEETNKMLKFAEKEANFYRMSQREALSAAGQYGVILKNIGLTNEYAGRLSRNLVRRAGDIASAFNMSGQEVATAIRAGITGETEPLKRFGILLNESAIKAKALEMGFWDGEGAISQQAKTLATYNIIMEQTEVVQANAIKTSKSIAGQMEIMKSKVEDLMAEIGENLEPIIIRALEWLNDLLDYFLDLPEETQNWILAIVGIAAVVGPLLLILGSFVGAIGGIISAFTVIIPVIGTVIAAIASIGAPILIVIGLIVALVAAVIIYREEIAAWWQQMTEMMESIDIAQWFSDLKDSITENLDTLITSIKEWADELMDNFLDWGQGLIDNLIDGIKARWEALKQTIQQTAENINRWFEENLGASFVEITGGSQGAGTGTQSSSGTYSNVSGGLRESGNIFNKFWGTPSSKISVGHVEYHGSFSQSEMAYLSRMQERTAENVTLDALEGVE